MKFTLPILLLLTLFLPGGRLFSQSDCRDSSYRKFYFSGNDSLKITAQVSTIDGGYALIGEFRTHGSNTIQGLIIKTDAQGAVQWSKKYNAVNSDNILLLRIIQSNDGSLVVLGRLSAAAATFGNNLLLLRISATGSTLWQEQYNMQPFADTNPAILPTSVTEGGNKELFITATVNGHLAGSAAGWYNLLLKTNEYGALLFSKAFAVTNGELDGPIGSMVVNDSLVVWGASEAAACQGLDTRSLYNTVLDAQTGNFRSAMRYCFSQLVSINSYEVSPYAFTVSRIMNEFVVLAKITESATPRKFAVFRFDSTLRVANSFNIAPPSGLRSFGEIKASPDGSIIFLNHNSSSSGMYYTYLDKYGQVIRQRKIQLPAPGDPSRYGEGGHRIAPTAEGISFVTNYTYGTNSGFELFFANKDQKSTVCTGADTAFGLTSPFSVDATAFSWENVVDHPVTSQTLTLSSADVPVASNDICTEISICNTLDIAGPDTVCVLGQPSEFTFRKNASCNKEVIWQIDTAVLRSITVINDTTVHIVFKMPQYTPLLVKVKAVVNGCSDVADSLWVRLFAIAKPFNAGPKICPGDTIPLSIGNWFKSYTWHDGSTDSVFKATRPGKYWVTVQAWCGYRMSDTIELTGPSPHLLKQDTVIKCNNDSIYLYANGNLSNYQWSPVSDVTIISDSVVRVAPFADANFQLSADAYPGCRVSDTVFVKVRSSAAINLPPDTSICEGVSVDLDAGAGFLDYVWNTGERTRQISVSRPGMYTVAAQQDNLCVSRDTMRIINVYARPKNFLLPDAVLCKSETLMLSSNQTFRTYLWNTGESQSEIKIASPGLYWLEVVDNNNCAARDSISVTEKNCLNKLIFPNAFSPNADKKNDVFRPAYYGNVVAYRLNVYNRWGQLAFTSNDPARGWDGTINGTAQPTGNYVWVCTYTLAGEQPKVIKGSLLLVH
jgi:gliding motility-associated-like protein